MNLNFNPQKITSQINPLFTYLQKQRENQRVARLIELSSTLFLISFFILFAIKPTILTISKLVGDIKSKELMTKELKGKIDDVIAAQDLFSQVQEKYQLIESSLPTSPGFYQANFQIISLSQAKQIPLEKINYLVKESDTFYTTSVSTASSYSTALSFLSDLLRNRRLIGLDNFTFSVDKEETQNQKINFNFPLKIYYWPKND